MMRGIISSTIIIILLVAGYPLQASILQDLSRDIVALARKTSPSVVQIDVEKKSDRILLEKEKYPAVRAKSIGSGFVIDRDGYILTANHVIEGAEKITVNFQGRPSAEATLVGSDALLDAAVIKVDVRDLKPLELGDSDSLEPGALVVSINSQAGMLNTVSLGVVAGTGRQTAIGRVSLNVIQISGTVGPGAGGGPVLDTSGRVVGMITAMLSPSKTLSPFDILNIYYLSPEYRLDLERRFDLQKRLEDAKDALEQLRREKSDRHPDVLKKKLEVEELQRRLDDASQRLRISTSQVGPERRSFIQLPALQDLLQALRPLLGDVRETSMTSGSTSFAIPINAIKPILDDLKAGRAIQHSWLGVMVLERDGELVVSEVLRGPAEEAGIKAGDVIVKADGRSFTRSSDFSAYVLGRKPGDTISLLIRRKDREIEVPITLAVRPEKPAAAADQPQKRSQDVPQIASIKPGKLLSLDLENADISEAAKVLSEASGKSIILVEPEKIKGRVTLHLKSMTVENALNSICGALGCRYRKEADTYLISPR